MRAAIKADVPAPQPILRILPLISILINLCSKAVCLALHRSLFPTGQGLPAKDVAFSPWIDRITLVPNDRYKEQDSQALETCMGQYI